ncbi:ABC transporter ATP-binding protein [Oceanicella actignis]|uniref:Putative ABC transport system ATP-binding protein n=1 Tax=Oceanicella actignis TaxID=1189325 RepID=A0A1M7SH39_9RHOB|nr:ABC transporter ATP-binding protein [Oceanicella actignis]SET20117.1 putative ABC transport system ATP-binding protein [Oceanicella actignis]SHN57806.1 putative ABC transport system ATP-binding protein [Oceanicella actignis]
MLSVTDLRKTYPAPDRPVEALRGASLEIGAGEAVALTGESGSGKSTLLHIIAGLDEADSGSVRVDGREMSGLSDGARARLRRARIGLVFQQLNLIPSLNVWDNLTFQARLAGREDRAFARALLGRLGLEGLERRYPEELSGGQQQRVAIGRALAHRPALVLADEPTGSLDEAAADRALDLLLELTRDAGAALLMATHSLRLAARLDRRLHLSGGVLREAACGGAGRAAGMSAAGGGG